MIWKYIIVTIINLVLYVVSLLFMNYRIYFHFSMVVFLFNIIPSILLFQSYIFCFFGYKNRLRIFNEINLGLPQGRIFKVVKGFFREFVIYEFSYKHLRKKMKILFSPHFFAGVIYTPLTYEIWMNTEYYFELDIWRGLGERFNTNYQKLEKFSYILTEMNFGERIRYKNSKKQLRAYARSVEHMFWFIQVLIDILYTIDE